MSRWQERARCADADPDIFFPEARGRADAAKAVCADCPVTDECLQYALDSFTATDDLGVWGGLTEKQRRRLRKQRQKAAA